MLYFSKQEVGYFLPVLFLAIPDGTRSRFEHRALKPFPQHDTRESFLLARSSCVAVRVAHI